MSHEFAEMITDPLYNAWTPDHAGHEIGDYCAWQETTITVSGRTWTVQEIWSDVANACAASSANRIPPISPGPGGMPAQDGESVVRLGRGPGKALDPADVLPHHRVLPLPPVRFNHLTGEKRIDDADMLTYTRNLFSPLRHEHVFDDFPAFLRQAAGVLEGRSAAANGAAGSEARDTAPAAANGADGSEAPGDTTSSEVPVGAQALRRQGITPKRAGDRRTASTT